VERIRRPECFSYNPYDPISAMFTAQERVRREVHQEEPARVAFATRIALGARDSIAIAKRSTSRTTSRCTSIRHRSMGNRRQNPCACADSTPATRIPY
jgi:hypothetical protein